MSEQIPEHCVERFSGKTVIVTGAGSGIGRATAIRLAHEGAHVVGCDLSEPRLNELTAQYPELKFTVVAGDVSQEETVQRAVAAAQGRVDALANIAGIMDAFLPPAEMLDEVWERVFAVNVTAIMRLTRAVLPLMLAAKTGSIVNVSSEASLRASAAGAAYTASKNAVNGFTKSTAVFYKDDGIRCNAVAPGAVRTNIEAQFKSQHAIEVLGPHMQMIPAPASPEQLAASICFLLSDDASNVNGAVLACDGGWSAF